MQAPKCRWIISKDFRLPSQLNFWLPSPSHSYSHHSKERKKELRLTASINTSDSYRTQGTFPATVPELWWLKCEKTRSFKKYPCKIKSKQIGKNKKRWQFRQEVKLKTTKAQPLLQLSSTPSLDTILADVSREVKEQIFHVRFYCFKNNSPFPLIFHHSVSITMHRVITLITLLKINTRMKRTERRLGFFWFLYCF